ncbi:hypothetical protein SAMN05216276_10552 [Streptosporangium subroseum]|uniref:N-acetyltransferase domain-containing protein n=1 Tax=Streptosporangium subroseum TaxID=106412 RepID=A0A239NC84_9ACTN|nr:GNAT family N-acetyltransferase [Streptosporangium subroseum]SNT52521.1 hypothetical protein SAMN05216276_10552 [Streptosporangium subroseum]
MEKPTGISVRNGRLGDVGALLAFWLKAAEGTDRHDDPAKVVALIERDPEAVLIAEIDGEMAGTLIAGWDGWRAHLYRLAVDPARRRQGSGVSLSARRRSASRNWERSAPTPWCSTRMSWPTTPGGQPATPLNPNGLDGSSR